MTDTNQSEALRLALMLDGISTRSSLTDKILSQAAAELRRLQAEIEALRARSQEVGAAAKQMTTNTNAALVEYANPLNWDVDENGIRRVWKEPGSETPEAYNGFELAKAALSTAAQPPALTGDPAEPRDDSDRVYDRPVGYLPAYELSRLHSGHGAQLRSAKFGPSAIDGDVPVYLESSALALVQALIGAQRAINSMKVEAETAAQGDEQMMLDACEQISNEGLEASLAIQSALSTAAQPPAGFVMVPTELAERVQETMGEFLMDHGWRQQDMDTSDEFGALLAVATKAEPAPPDYADAYQGRGRT